MAAPNPSALAMVPFVSVQDMMRIVNAIGPRQMLRELCAYIEADFRRWETFDKTPRIPAHSEEGVIELMPTTDGEHYGFKYVNGHPPIWHADIRRSQPSAFWPKSPTAIRFCSRK